MSSVSKTILIGRVGKEPEVRALESGLKVCSFSLATSESWKDKTTGEKQERTEWHNIVIWGKLADVVEFYVSKGDQLYLEGQNRTESYQDKDGNTRYVTKVVCNSMTMLGSKKDSNQEENEPQQSEDDEEPVLPF